ncbi:MAG: immunity 26/phosphotriesterase HocA family protein [bacterium]|nr:immunity 26/phosphotriesterase HocA family protein [bacterium]
MEGAIKSGVLVTDSDMTHDEMVSEIKALSKRISLESAAKSFLYSLSSGDMRYRSALSSIVWARSLPEHEFISNGVEKNEWRTPVCIVCGCSHGLDGKETIDWNKYGVFRYLPPKQYGREPNFTCAEYVLNDLREFEKLPVVDPCYEDYRILNGIFACVGDMKSHNTDTALLADIRKRKFFNATGCAIHCILGVLSICGILESTENKGFLHSYVNFANHGMARDGLTFYPLDFWRGRDGVNYQAVAEIFGSFSKDELLPEKAVIPESNENISSTEKKSISKAEQYFTDDVYTIILTDEERRYLALNALDKNWEKVSIYSVTHCLKKRTVLFYEGNTIVKVIYEEHSIKEDGSYSWRAYNEFDTRLETDNRTMLLPLTSRGRAKAVTPTNVMAIKPFGCDLYIYLQKDESQIVARNLRNNQVIPIGEKDRVRNIMSDEDFHKFMRYYIPTCPDDYFENIAAVRNMEHKTVRFKAGDIFRCQVDRNHYAYGLILGKIREIEKWDELPKEHSFRHVMMQPIIVRMYDFVTTDKDMTAEELSDRALRPPKLCSDCDILWGTHTIVAHKELVVDDVQFLLQLARQGKKNKHFTLFTAETFVKMSPKNLKPRMNTPRSLYVEWGFASFEIPWEKVPDNIRMLLDEGVYFDGGVAMGISADLCGKSLSDILKESPKHLIQHNLLLSENRDRFNLIMNFLGLPDNCTLDDFAAKNGGISRQKYIELLGERSK